MCVCAYSKHLIRIAVCTVYYNDKTGFVKRAVDGPSIQRPRIEKRFPGNACHRSRSGAVYLL